MPYVVGPYSSSRLMFANASIHRAVRFTNKDLSSPDCVLVVAKTLRIALQEFVRGTGCTLKPDFLTGAYRFSAAGSSSAPILVGISIVRNGERLSSAEPEDPLEDDDVVLLEGVIC